MPVKHVVIKIKEPTWQGRVKHSSVSIGGYDLYHMIKFGKMLIFNNNFYVSVPITNTWIAVIGHLFPVIIA